MSRRTALSRPWLSSCPVADWNRRLNSSSLPFFSSAASASSSISSSLSGTSALDPIAISCHHPREPRTDTSSELVHGAPHGLAGQGLVNAGQLEHDPAGLDIGDPPLGGPLAGTHPGLGRLLGDRSVRVDVDPHLAATLDVAGHGDTRGLDLPVGDVGRLESLDPELTERDGGTARRSPRTAGVMLLAVLDPARDEHDQASVPLSGAASATGAATASAAGASARSRRGASARSRRGARAGRSDRSERSGRSERGPRGARGAAVACSRANSFSVMSPL